MDWTIRVGDVVEIIKPFWVGDEDFQGYVGRIAVVIEISGGNLKLGFFDGNSSAWWSSHQLEFIAHSDKAYEAYKEIADETDKQDCDLRWIKSRYPKISSRAWVFLMSAVGIESTLKRTGEYALFICEARTLKPIYDALFEGDKNKMLEEVSNTLKDKEKYKKNFSELFDKVREIDKEMK